MYNDANTRPSGWYLLVVHHDGRRERLPIVAWDLDTYRAERDDPEFEGHPNACASAVTCDGASLVSGLQLLTEGDGVEDLRVHHPEHAPEPRRDSARAASAIS